MIKISLKWRVLIPIAALFMICAISSVIYIKNSLQSTFIDNRQQLSSENRMLVENTINIFRDSIDKSKRLIIFYISMLSESHDDTNIKNSINSSPLWNELNNEFRIDELWLFDSKDSRLIGSWGRGVDEVSGDVLISELGRKASFDVNKEFIYCHPSCVYYKKVTLEGVRNNDVWALLGISLERLVNRFSTLSDSDIVILSNNPDDLNGELPATLWLPNFNSYAYASSKLISMLKLLKAAPDIHSDSLSKQPMNFIYKEKTWEIMFSPTSFNSIYLVFVSDISSDLIKLDQSEKGMLSIMTASFFSLILLAFFSIHKQLQRLDRIGEVIPLLGSSQFAMLRQAIGTPKQSFFYQDEVGLIHRAAYEVSHRLESLENSLHANTLQLNEALSRISMQHEFLEGLIDNSRVLIIAQNTHGHLTLINKLAEQYAKVSGDIIGKPLNEVFNDIVAKQLNEHIRLIDQAPVQQEMGMTCNDSDMHWISWIHCRLTSASDQDETLFLSVGMDITERKKAEQEIRQLAERDSLTNLYNRRTFTVKSEKIIEESESRGIVNTLLYIDLNKFKKINDTFGHQVGDQYLIEVSEVLKKNSIGNRLAGRLGGDEFTMLIPNTKEKQALILAEEIAKEIRSMHVPGLDPSFNAGASIGIALSPMHGSTITALLQSADVAMYSSKHTDNYKVFLFNNSLQQATKPKENPSIKDILSISTLDVYTQPIIDLSSKKVVAFECLTRAHRLDTTQEFDTQQLFEYAEKNNLIEDLDLYVMEKIFGHVTNFMRLQDKNVYLTINLSAKSISSERFLAQFLLLSDRYFIDFSRLVFEITETSFAFNMAAANIFINAIKRKGGLFAIDDYGNGFSNLRMLRSLSFDWLKIDGCFIQHIASNPHDQAIVENIIHIAYKMGLKIICEGVETELAYNYLHRYPIDMLQGYYLGKPKPLEFSQQLPAKGVRSLQAVAH